MGIPHLNRQLRTRCPDAIKKVELSSLSGKRIAVDASIYMYRAIADGNLVEGMFQLLSVIEHTGITPVLVFDGKAPIEKEDVLKERREKREKALIRQKEIEGLLLTCDDQDEKDELTAELASTKKATVKVTRRDGTAVRDLAMSMGVPFLEAEGEADALCAKLVNKKHVYACLSEDMDMFAYGCLRVLRYLSLLNRTAILYDFTDICATLNMTTTEFTDVCVLSGTDYNRGVSKRIHVGQALELHSKWKMSNANEGLFEWCESNGHLGEDGNHLKLFTISQMFNLANFDIGRKIDAHVLRSGPIAIENIERVLAPFGFVFIQPGWLQSEIEGT